MSRVAKHLPTSKLLGHICMCLLLLALVGRGLIPTGFMLGHAPFNQGAIELTFCAPGGSFSKILLDSGHSDSDQANAECPFSVLVHQALDIPNAGNTSPLPVAAFSRPLPPSLYQSRPALPALGPPLGSRAPPLHLG